MLLWISFSLCDLNFASWRGLRFIASLPQCSSSFVVVVVVVVLMQHSTHSKLRLKTCKVLLDNF